jgi:hypothetical protein
VAGTAKTGDAMIDGSGFSQLDRLLALVRTTRELLDGVVDAGELPAGGAAFLEGATLPHLEGVQSGFQGSLRSEAAGAEELRYLLLQVAQARVTPPVNDAERLAADAEARAERRLLDAALDETAATSRRRSALLAFEAWHLAAFAHARVVLALIPRLPEDRVRFPTGRRTYADIPTPRGPAELSARIDELERELWRAVTGRPSAPTEPSFRRAYSFFDTADQLGYRAFRDAA